MNEQEWLNEKPSYCDYCGKQEQFLQPYVKEGTTNPIISWCCFRCVVQAGLEGLSVTYTHVIFFPGIQIYIHPSVLEAHERFQYAGRLAITCEGTFYPMLEAYGERQREKVPVRFSDGYECFLDEKYVEKI